MPLKDFKKVPINMPLNNPVVKTKLVCDSIISTKAQVKNGFEAIEEVERYIVDNASEAAYAIALGKEMEPLCVARIGVGGVQNTAVSIRDIVRTALLANAYAMVFLHNHPNDRKDLYPSKDDIELTQAIAKACNTIGVLFYDSIIVECSDGMRYKSYSSRFDQVYVKRLEPIRETEGCACSDVDYNDR